MLNRKFRSLELSVKKAINAFGSGSHFSRLQDSIIEVDVSREYQPGDKRLDSRTSLRTGRSMSRVFAPDKAMTVFLGLDVSASVYSKLDQAVSASLYLTYLAEQAADQVGLVTFSDKIHNFVLPSPDGRGVSDTLERFYEKGQAAGSTKLEAALSRFGGMELSNTLVVLLSDFCYPISDEAVQLSRKIASGQNNTVVAVALVNKQEWSLVKQPFAVDFLDAESGSKTLWNFGSKKANGRHQDRFRTWLVEVKTKLRQAGAQPVVIYDDLMPLVRFFLR